MNIKSLILVLVVLFLIFFVNKVAQVCNYNISIAIWSLKLATDPNNVQELYNRATLFRQCDNHKKAIDDFYRIIQIYSKDKTLFKSNPDTLLGSYLHLGEHLLKIGKEDEAIYFLKLYTEAECSEKEENDLDLNLSSVKRRYPETYKKLKNNTINC